MLDKIIETLAKYTDYDKKKMNRDTSILVDLGLTSLDVVRIIMELEEEYNVEFDEDELGNITTIGELEDYFKSLC